MSRTTTLFPSFLMIALALSQLWYVGHCGTEAEMRNLLNATLNNTDYSSRVRPISDTGNTLQVKIDLYLIAINDIDEVEQKMTSTAYLSIEWPDTFITWTPADYGNINKITIPQSRIWKPDIALANAYDTIVGLGSSFMYVEINNGGVITWRPYQVFDSSCTLDMTYFPFDEQNCELQFVTWSSTKDMIGLVTGSVGFNVENYATNANWDMVSHTAYDSSTSSTSGLSFSMKLKRKPVFFLINFIVPILLLSFLNIFVFILPCDSGEKASYAIVLFLSFAIFLLIVTEMMPEGMTTVPVISTYLMLECVISTLIVFFTIVQLRLHNMGEDTDVPKFLQRLVALKNKLKDKLKCKSCKNSNKEDGLVDNDGDSNGSKVELRSSIVVSAGKSPKAAEAMDNDDEQNKVSLSKKFRDIVHGRKVTPQALFTKPEIQSTPYDADIELQDLEGKRDSDVESKRRPIHAVGSTPATVHFMNKRRQSLVSESNKSEDESEEEPVEWSDVTEAIDWFFLYLFAIITIIITFVVIVLLVSL